MHPSIERLTIYADTLDRIHQTRPASASERQHVADLRDLLAEHKPDDDEPITYEWLRAVRFLPDGSEANKDLSIRIWDIHESELDDESPAMHVVIDLVDCSCFLETYGVDGESLAVVEIAARKTRGQVRRLCSELGIQLKEQS